jgi:hypothetical protein
LWSEEGRGRGARLGMRTDGDVGQGSESLFQTLAVAS